MQADTLSGWLQEFSLLHQRAKRGELNETERTEYLKAREELADAMLMAQNNPHRGANQRKTMRVAQALPIELETPTGRGLAVTLDLSAGGFSTILSEAPPIGTHIRFLLKLGRGSPPIDGSARVVNMVPQNGSVRVGLAFNQLGAEDRERLEFVIVDAVIKQFGG